MKFLASVGVGQLFRIEDGEPKLFATARTLTETSLQFSSQSTDVVSGAGDQLADTFTGQGRLRIDLTEVNFDLNYLSGLLSPQSVLDPKVFFSEKKEVEENRVVSLSRIPAQLGKSFGLDKYLIFYKKIGEPDSRWRSFLISEEAAYNRTITLPDTSLSEGEEVCLKYFISVPQAQSVLIGANFFPQEIALVLTTKLISSETDRVEDGQVEGEIVFRIPRFKLDANFNLQMAMSSFASVPVSGVALAYSDESDPFATRYGEIVEYHSGTDIKTGLTAIYVDAETDQSLGLYEDGHAALMPIDTVVPTDIFSGCLSLVTAEIASTVTSIQADAFSGCDLLTVVTLYSIAPPSLGSDSAFPNSCVFYVPPQSVSDYKTQWPDLNERIFAFPSAQLYVPSLEVEQSILKIDSPNTVSGLQYRVYEGGVYQTTVDTQEGSTDAQLSLDSYGPGTYSFEAIASAAGYIDSMASLPVSYTLYSINGSGLVYGRLEGSSSILPYGTTQLVIVPQDYCDPPSTTADVSASNCTYSYSVSGRQGILTISDVSGDVAVAATCVPQLFSIQTNVINGSASGDTSMTHFVDGTVYIAPSTTLYNLPENSGDISVSGATKKSYNPTTGELVLTQATTIVSVSCTCQPKTFSVSTNITRGTFDGPSTITAYSSTSGVIQPSEGYGYPSLVTVNNAVAAYTSSNGVLELSDPYSGVEISAICPGILSFTSLGDGTCEVSLGTFEDLDVTIPSISPSGDTVVKVGDEGFLESSIISVIVPSSVTVIGEVAFASCEALSSVSLSEGLSSIGDSAFVSCVTLAYISVPSSVVSIDAAAFADCEALTSVSLSEGLSSIGDGAFAECYSLTSVIIPNTVTSVGMGLFAACTNLQWVEIGSGVEIIGDNCFEECESLTSVIIDGELLEIPDQMFYYCGALEAINLPDSVTIIGSQAFYYCTSLESIEIPDNLASIGSYAFYYCTSLEGVEFPDGLANFGYRAFSGCTSLTGITIPNGVARIGGYAFSGCSNLSSVVFLSISPPVCDAHVFDNTNNCPIYVPGAALSVYRTATNLSSYESRMVGRYPITVTVTNGSYSGDNIVLSDNTTAVVTLMADAGYYPPLDVSVVGATFLYNPNEGTVYLSNPTESVSIIASCITGSQGLAFTSNNDGTCYVSGIGTCADTDIMIPFASPAGDSVTSIGSSAFASLTSFISVKIPDSVTSIRYNAFQGCTTLENIEIPNSVTSIGEGAFANCSSLISIEIPSGVMRINTLALYNCTSLTSVDIPNSVTSIGEGAFSGCSSLTSMTVATGNPVYHSARNCIIKTATGTLIAGCGSSVIPTDGSVMSIGEYAFSHYTSLTSITIPDSVESIYNGAFNTCTSLTSVKIGNGVSGIGADAFKNCTSLMSVTVEPQYPPGIGSDCFTNTNNCPIYVPASSVSVYKTEWPAYEQRIQAISA